jgi:hypothetical protein
MIATQDIALRSNSQLPDGRWLFDVVAHPWFGFGLDRQPDAEVIGQIVVEMNRPDLVPDQFQLWDVEPMGTIDGRTNSGLVIRVPLVHFWRYHVSGKDAEPPTTVVIPPQYARDPTSTAPVDTTQPVASQHLTPDQRYQLDRQKILDTINNGRYQSETSILLKLLARADEIRRSAHDELSGTTARSDWSTSHTFLIQSKGNNADLTVDMTANLLTRTQPVPASIVTPRVTGELNELIAGYPKMSDLLQKYTKDSTAIATCKNDPSSLTADLADIKTSSLGSNSQDTSNLSTIRFQLNLIYSEMLMSDISYNLGCYNDLSTKH